MDILEKGMTENEMVGWHHWLNGHDFEQAPGVRDGQGSLACCSPWGRKESDRTEQLNWTERTLMHMQWEVLESTFHWVVRAKKFACGCGASTTSPVWFLLCSWTHPSLHKAIFLFIFNFYLFIYLFFKAIFKWWVHWDKSSATRFDLHDP